MKKRKENGIVRNNTKKIYSLTLSPKIVNEFENLIGYNSRSHVVENLIREFVKKKRGTSAKKSHSLERAKEVLF